MKTVITLLLLVCSIVVCTNAQAERTLIKSLPLNEATAVKLDLLGRVTVKKWDKDFIRLTVDIQLQNFNETILKHLIEVGRYDLVTDQTAGQLLVAMPNIAKTVTIRGTELRERFEYTIAVPEGLSVEFQQPRALSFLQDDYTYSLNLNR